MLYDFSDCKACIITRVGGFRLPLQEYYHLILTRVCLYRLLFSAKIVLPLQNQSVKKDNLYKYAESVDLKHI